MKATHLIGHDLHHTTDPDIAGKITDIVFDQSLKEAAYFLAEITAPAATATILLSPTVLNLVDDKIEISASAEDIAERIDASIRRTSVDVDPTALPSTLIGPFGNTMSPSLIAALFNARTGPEKVKAPIEGGGVWFTDLKGHAVRAHVADIGHVSDVALRPDLTTCDVIEVAAFDGDHMTLPPANIQSGQSADGGLLLSVRQDGERT
ncbi:hypothetical protein [Roseobacter sp. CCS2]|uniref:hypothetical protein n=1 Tax=Roseobacter sp. CCS2 TaxID=391593 RepID=UPI0000F3F157|nr:hypothetical protein [Roseobacter sp. CCS2]EBA11160.1 hypothetical protein RCCS2_10325 [Roseobacter sp. CCS2]